MFAAIRSQVSRLFDLSGRDGRARFLWWFLFVFIVQLLILFVAMLPMLGDAFEAGMTAASAGNEAAMDAAMLETLAARSGQVALVGVALGVLSMILMAAATVRRLHDIGKHGVWAAAIGAVYALSQYVAWKQSVRVSTAIRASGANEAAVDQALNAGGGVEALLGYAPLIALLVIGILKSQPGPNRWGEPPAA